LMLVIRKIGDRALQFLVLGLTQGALS